MRGHSGLDAPGLNLYSSMRCDVEIVKCVVVILVGVAMLVVPPQVLWALLGVLAVAVIVLVILVVRCK